MQEPLRNAYLKAMGIEVWSQRVAMPVVPGADSTFAFGVVDAAPDLCVLFELPDGVVEPAEGTRQLVRDLVRALGGDAQNLAIDVSELPIAGDADEEVSGVVASHLRQVTGDDERRVLIMGERVAAMLSDERREHDFARCRFCSVAGVDAITAEPLLKRDVWQQVQPLLRGA